jgi:hypothetical protein
VIETTGQITVPPAPKLGGQHPLTANKPPAPQAPLTTAKAGLEPGQQLMVRRAAIQKVTS